MADSNIPGGSTVMASSMAIAVCLGAFAESSRSILVEVIGVSCCTVIVVAALAHNVLLHRGREGTVRKAVEEISRSSVEPPHQNGTRPV